MCCPKCQFENLPDSHYCSKCGSALVSQTQTLQTFQPYLAMGSTFTGRYQVIEEIGKGGMGQVYKVFDSEIKEKIALKLLRPEIASDETTIERFRQELKLARKITHHNVCRMYDLGKEEATYYITMEFVDGEDLKSFLRKSGQIPIKKAISIAKQICEGLAIAHKFRFVHRDLKPQNIMIDKDANAKIMDFGIARSIEARGITGTGFMIGTPDYMSPEQAEAKQVDQRSDIYSLGVVLFEMTTGKVPFEGDTPFSIALQHKSKLPPNPKDLNSQISDDLSQIILKCLEKEKEKRYQEVDSLLRALENVEKPKKTPPLPDWKNSIAVLPFTDLSPGKDQEYFCDGISEEIINALTQIKELRTVARTSAFAFKGKDSDIREIGKKLNVGTILEGSIRKSGNRLRITAQLINVDDGYHLWSERFDRDMEDVFAIQDEISLQIVNKLKAKLGHKEKGRLIKRYTDNVEAYNLYLKGRYHWNKITEEGLNKGLEYFQQVIERDPTHALAYSGIADCHTRLSWYYYRPAKEELPKAKTAAKKSLEIDASLSEAHASLGFAILLHDFNWVGAEEELKKAIRLNPGNANARFYYSVLLAAVGRYDESIVEAKKGAELNPLDLMAIVNVGLRYYYAGMYDDALEHAKKAIEMDPNSMIGHYYTGFLYARKGEHEKAIQAIQNATLLAGSHPQFLSVFGFIYALSGQKEKAIEMLEKLMSLSKPTKFSMLFIPMIYSALDEKDHAFEWLEKAYEAHVPMLIWLKSEPAFHVLKQDPRYTEFLKRLGLDE
ncbi:MAG: protein kinase [Candidatus Aminicenantes bacterium]|nr:protein kinase [Candidatus Aminicenantes bacterium]